MNTEFEPIVGKCAGCETRGNFLHRPGKPRIVQHILYEFLIGPIPEGLYLLHWAGCKCVNPFHCYPGDDRQNKIDRLLHATNARDMEREAF